MSLSLHHDLLGESLIRLADVPDILPAKRGGKRVHVNTVYRWTTRGCEKAVLESICQGGASYTSREALARFNLQVAVNRRDRATRIYRSPAARAKATRAADKRLAALGR